MTRLPERTLRFVRASSGTVEMVFDDEGWIRAIYFVDRFSPPKSPRDVWKSGITTLARRIY